MGMSIVENFTKQVKQADEYIESKEKTYAEMIKMPDYSESEMNLENNEIDSDSRQITPTATSNHSATSQATPQSMTHNINVNYHHSYSIKRKNDEQIDIPSLLQSLSQHTSLQSPSVKLQPQTKNSSDKIDSFIKPKQKIIFLGNPPKAFTFTDLDIIEPPNVKYANDIDRLIHDWDNTSYLVIKDISIPLKYWSQVFRWAKPKTWEVMKDNWTNWRVCSYIHLRKIRSF